jgi:polyisoprenoid-binding protein YceI
MASTVVKHASEISLWDIDPLHSSVQFSVRHMMISNVRGEFKWLSVQCASTRRISPTSVDATIDATSINTREPNRDTHLKSADFIDTALSEITFLSTSIEKTPQNHTRSSVT